MMRLRMKVSMAGPQVVRRPGEEVEVHDSEGLRLLAAGFAEVVVPESLGTLASLDWPLAIAPQDYLRRFPAGPNAALARRLLSPEPVEVR